jgi:hypothetical protein
VIEMRVRGLYREYERTGQLAHSRAVADGAIAADASVGVNCPVRRFQTRLICSC